MQDSIRANMQKSYRRFLFEFTRFLSFIRWLYLSQLPFVKIHPSCYIEHNVKISSFYGGYVRIGRNCTLRNGSRLLTYGGKITIGNNCSINPFTILYGQGDLKIGNNVRIAAECVIIPSNHNFSRCDVPINEQGLSSLGIVIEDDVWIGCGARILDGVTIKKGCVIGAGCVVTKSTDPYCVYAGVPAKKINSRF